MAETKAPPQNPAAANPPSSFTITDKSILPAGVSNELDEVMRRIRLIEDRYSGLRKKTQFTEQNMLKDTKDIYEEISVLRSTISDIKNEVSELNEKLIKLTEEVGNSVKISDFNILAKYVDYWQPLNFLTREQAEKLLDEYASRKQSNSLPKSQ